MFLPALRLSVERFVWFCRRGGGGREGGGGGIYDVDAIIEGVEGIERIAAAVKHWERYETIDVVEYGSVDVKEA